MRGRQRSATVWPRAFVTSSSTSHQARTRRSGRGMCVSRVRCHASCGLLTIRRSLCCSPTGDEESERWSIPTSSEAQANHPVVEPLALGEWCAVSSRLLVVLRFAEHDLPAPGTDSGGRDVEIARAIRAAAVLPVGFCGQRWFVAARGRALPRLPQRDHTTAAGQRVRFRSGLQPPVNH